VTTTGLRSKLVTGALLTPALLFLVTALFLPLGLMIWESIRDVEVRDALPLTVESLREWRADEPVPAKAYAALVEDLASQPTGKIAQAARRLNVEASSLRTVLLAAANAQISAKIADPRGALIAAHRRWAQPDPWIALRAASGPFTARFLLAAVDLEENPEGQIAMRSADRAIYRGIFLRTFLVAWIVTALCFVVGLPLALFLASLTARTCRTLLLLIMLPLWTSVLVRAMAWILILGSNGVVNAALVGGGIVAQPLALIFNRFSVIVTMTHVLLPFMVLPLTDALRRVPRDQLRAAGSLGATPWTVLRRIYLPQASAGLAAGLILVFASGAGYYITPALVGGGSDQMLGAFVQQAALRIGDPQLAAALGVVFLSIFVLVLTALAILFGRSALQRRELSHA
jgi:putative spermidine/putrescine transport system permease protein